MAETYKVKIRNTYTDESRIALMNPSMLELNSQAALEKNNSLASSNVILNYKHTETKPFTLQFFISRAYLRSVNQNDVREMKNWLNFFYAATYAPEENVYNNISLTPHLLIWPEMIAGEYYITNVSSTMEKFDETGLATFAFINVTFEEITPEKIRTYERVRKYGFNSPVL